MRAFLLNRLSQSLVLLVIVSIIGFIVLNLHARVGRWRNTGSIPA